MKIRYAPLMVAVALMVLLSATGNAVAAYNATTASASMDLEALAERMRQTSLGLQEDIRRARARRETLETELDANRRKEAEQARQQATRDAAQVAALKSARERQAAEAALAQARQEAAERVAKAEAERLAAIKAQQELEKSATKQLDKVEEERRHLGREPKFGVDI
jgi:hypothetical protein